MNARLAQILSLGDSAPEMAEEYQLRRAVIAAHHGTIAAEERLGRALRAYAEVAGTYGNDPRFSVIRSDGAR